MDPASQVFSANSPSDMLLAMGLEQEGVRVCLLDTVAGRHRLIGWLGLQDDGSLEPAQLIARACRRLGQRLGCTLWDERLNEPLVSSDDPLRIPPLAHVSVGLLRQPALRTWLAGLSSSVSLAVLEQVVSGAPAQIVGQTTLSCDPDRQALAMALKQTQPDVLVIAGGFDDPTPAAQAPLFALCHLLGDALTAAAPAVQPAIFFAGNRFVAPAAADLLAQGRADLSITLLDNIMPASGRVEQRELARLLNYHDWRLNERTPSFGRFSRWVTSPGQVSSLAANFAQLTRVWLEHARLSELRGLYCTTHWWLHSLASQGQDGVRLVYAPPGSEPGVVARWPAVGMISGPWNGAGCRTAREFWWDAEGLAPVVAGIGQVAPLAMMQTLDADLLPVYKGG